MSDLEKLKALGSGFTTSEAADALGWSLSSRALAHQLRQLGFVALRTRRSPGEAAINRWTSPDDRRGDCACRCHTGTCGENAMVLAERAIMLVERLRPVGGDAIAEIANLVERAGVDFARDALQARLDDQVPF